MEDKNRTYSVATFQVTNDCENNMATREYVIVNSGLSLSEARKTRGENRGSWIVPERYGKS